MAMIKTCSTPPIAFPEVSGPVCSFKALQELPLKKCEVAINAWQEGSGDPSPDNNRPIHGWDEVNVSQSGVNIWDEDWEEGGYDNTTGEKTSSNILYRNVDFISVKPNTSYYFTVANGNRRVWYYDINKTFISSRNGSTAFAFTTPPDCYYINFALSRSAWNDVSINYPSTDTNYHTYAGTTATIDLDGIRYGGIINVLTGEMSVTHVVNKIKDMNVAYYEPSSSYPLGFFIARGTPIKKPNITNVKASCFTTGYSWATDNHIFGNGANDYCYITCSSYSDANSFKTALGEQEILYELATPLTFNLTPTEIKTLVGINNVWSDAGDVDVTYRR